MKVTEELWKRAKGFPELVPPKGAELIGSRASYTQTAPGKEYLWITPDGQTWVDSDWIRHNKILNKLKED